MFRNVRYYEFGGDWPESETALSDALATASFEPCGPLTERSSGWIPIDPDTNDSLARRVAGSDLLRLRSQSRVLPAAAINEELEIRIAEFRERMQEAPTAREKRRLKAETHDQLLPKAMVKSDKIWGYVDPQQKILGIDTAQDAAAERFLVHLQSPLRGLNIRPLQYERPMGEFLTKIFLGQASRQFELGRECRLQDAADEKAIVRCTDCDLSERTIRSHVTGGMRLTQLGIVYDNMMSCVLNENGTITKIRFLDMDDDHEDHLEPLARLDAEFVLITGTLRRLLGDLAERLGRS
jgi:recombination associated protein RdgC